MASTARVLLRVVVKDANGLTVVQSEDLEEVADVVLENGKREQVTLANGFTALSPPTGVQLVVIRFISGAFTFTLKGVTGDTGIAMSSGVLAIFPVVLPLSAPSIGITCTGAGVVECIWL
jgi:hypothetical protein